VGVEPSHTRITHFWVYLFQPTPRITSLSTLPGRYVRTGRQPRLLDAEYYPRLQACERCACALGAARNTAPSGHLARSSLSLLLLLLLSRPAGPAPPAAPSPPPHLLARDPPEAMGACARGAQGHSPRGCAHTTRREKTFSSHTVRARVRAASRATFVAATLYSHQADEEERAAVGVAAAADAVVEAAAHFAHGKMAPERLLGRRVLRSAPVRCARLRPAPR
jgi:hypothetical protein